LKQRDKSDCDELHRYSSDNTEILSINLGAICSHTANKMLTAGN